jgi:hypothetical protein
LEFLLEQRGALEASGDAGLPPDKTGAFEGDDHLVNRGWAEAEAARSISASAGEHQAMYEWVLNEGGTSLAFGEDLRAGSASGA